MGEIVVVTGAGGPLGTRVCALAAADPGVARVVAVDPSLEVTRVASGVETSRLSFGDPGFAAVLEGADTLIHLGAATGPDLDGTGGSDVDTEGSRRLLGLAADAGIQHVVVLSTAMVYGAWPNNPVPLTEEAPLRPDPDLAYAVAKAELERQASEWRSSHPGCTVAVLRPTITVTPERVEWLGASPWSSHGVVPDDAEAPSQFLHLDDLAAAVDLARRDRLDGPLNVAPDGWLAAEVLRDLGGPTPRLRLPRPIATAVARLRYRLGWTSLPAELLAYRVHPWVVANDRLRAAGWAPGHSNEEAYVEADPAGPLAGLSPLRRQELSLAAAGAVLVSIVVGVVALVRHRARASS